MSKRTITSMADTLVLKHSALYPQGVQIYGFSTDAAFVAEAVEKTEVRKGVDNRVSAGRIPYVVTWNITLSGDSESNDVFDAIEDYERVTKERSEMEFIYTSPSLKEVKTFPESFITNFNPFAPREKVIGNRTFTVKSGDCLRSVLPD